MSIPVDVLLNKMLADAVLQSFAINKQFFEIEFSNSEYESIKFTVDCEFALNDESVINKLAFLEYVDPDVFKISYFIYLNRQKIVSISVDSSMMSVGFSNNLSLIFNLESSVDTPLAISFVRDYYEPGRVRILFDNDGCIQLKD